jgi:hypothetical protein
MGVISNTIVHMVPVLGPNVPARTAPGARPGCCGRACPASHGLAAPGQSRGCLVSRLGSPMSAGQPPAVHRDGARRVFSRRLTQHCTLAATATAAFTRRKKGRITQTNRIFHTPSSPTAPRCRGPRSSTTRTLAPTQPDAPTRPGLTQITPIAAGRRLQQGRPGSFASAERTYVLARRHREVMGCQERLLPSPATRCSPGASACALHPQKPGNSGRLER